MALLLQEYISKALLSTQIVRLQQCLTDIEFLRAKHYLILHDLGVIGEPLVIQSCIISIPSEAASNNGREFSAIHVDSFC